jgi:hypothetical protein
MFIYSSFRHVLGILVIYRFSEYYQPNWLLNIGKIGLPPGVSGGLQYSAKQNYSFCFFFWKKKNTTRGATYQLVDLLGASPQTPRVGFAEGWAAHNLLRSRTTLFASFSGKRRILQDEIHTNLMFYWGPAPKPPRSASPRVGQLIIFCEAELRFLLLFLEKEEYH